MQYPKRPAVLAMEWHGRKFMHLSAGLSLVAAGIHAIVMPEHFQEWWGYGVFFAVVAAAQGAYSVVLLWRPRPPLLALGIIGNVAVVVLYIVSRTVGVPLGPHAGVIEEVGAVDLAAKSVEVALIATLGVWLTSARRGSAVAR